jgi:serine/threonine protein kinase
MPLSSKVIGEGSFGCVHKPTLECADKKVSYKNKISKVMLTKHAISELKEYAVISKVDKRHDFYLGVPEKCKVKQNKYTIKSILNCKRLKRKNNNITSKTMLNKLSLIILPDGGLNLKQFIDKIYNQTNKSNARIRITKFWIECHRLFRGISTFQKHDIMHHDIKPQNIGFNSHGQLKIFDFGFAVINRGKSFFHQVCNFVRGDWNGTYDYTDPYYLSYCTSSNISDVYS